MKAKNGERSAGVSHSRAEPRSNRAEHSAPNTVNAAPRAQNAEFSGSFGLKEFIQGLAVGVLIGVLVTLIIR